MEDQDSSFASAKFWRKLIKITLLILFLVAFQSEIWSALTFVWLVLTDSIFHFPALVYDPGLRQTIAMDISTALTPQVTDALWLLFLLAAAYFSLFLIGVFLVAQFVLPIQENQDRWPAFVRLFLYWLQQLFFNKIRFHGAALFIKDGKQNERPDEAESLLPGVALVDLNSAIVIERQPFSPLGMKPGYSNKRNIKTEIKSNLGVRAAGPGLVFTDNREKIIGQVDLRKQIRILPDVQAYTREGIKVTTVIIAVFTVGEKEDIAYVAYFGGAKRPENLHFIQLGNGVIKEFYKIDPDEALEIYRALQNHQSEAAASPPIDTNKSTQTTFRPPYYFDPERVSAAVYAKSYNATRKDIEHWTDLPVKVATERFRDDIARVTYDYLYSPDNPSNDQIKTFKAKLARSIRHQGVMSYRFVEHKTEPFLHPGMAWDESKLNIGPVRPITTSRLLRDYGIKIIHAGFGELKPEEEIRKKMVENWMVQWEKEIETMKAENTLRAVRIRNNARAQAQLDMVSNLSKQYNAVGSRQAMALRVFQALETAATNPATSQLLPKDVFVMLQNLHRWLSPERKKQAEQPRRVNRNQRQGE